ncbi:MAG: transcriptional regulator PpsR [Xanthomonadales bacterium]|nr:transcriptional regulator PpsR [Xanthomonadales bacterium]
MDMINAPGFSDPRGSFGAIDAEGAAQLLALATDVSLVMTSEGVIEDLSLGAGDLPIANSDNWIGQRWIDTVTVESQTKIRELLDDAANARQPRWRQVNHPASGADIPIIYSAVRLKDGDRLVAFGRDVRPIAQLQRRLVDAQHSLERDYLRLRQAETRYRILFQESAEAVLILDASSRLIVDANPAASQLLNESAEQLVGTVFPRGFGADESSAVVSLLESVRGSGSSESATVRWQQRGQRVKVSASALLHDERPLLVVRLGTEARSADNNQLIDVLEQLPDALVITDTSGRILKVNHTFVRMAGLKDRKQTDQQAIERWLGMSGVDMPVLLATLNERGQVRLFNSALRDEYGSQVAVEVCAVSVPGPEKSYYAFSIRNVERRLEAPEDTANPVLPRSMEQLTELVGRVPLKDLVGEASDMVERLCIEAALNLTGDNRASAAEILGLSRQSLYVKLRRHGLAKRKSANDEEL